MDASAVRVKVKEEPKDEIKKESLHLDETLSPSIKSAHMVEQTKLIKIEASTKSSKVLPSVSHYHVKNSAQYFKSRHVITVPFICEECGEALESITELVRHFRSHFNGSLYECVVCLTPFSSSQALKKHMAVHSSDVKDCRQSASTVEGDKDVDKRTKVGSCTCMYCRRIFGSETDLEDHAVQHQVKELYTCDECGRCYQHKYLLDNHIKMHHVDLWSCEECGKTFENKKRLMVHYEMHNGIQVEKRHKCEECGKAFVARSKLLRHMRVHTGERPFRCEICGRGFNDRSNLFIHARIHTGEKPYACTICGKSFSGKNDLNRHEMIHSGTKPHKCKQCGKGFREKSKLNRHIKTHILPNSVQKAHTCPTCGKAFREKSKLKRHVKIHERDVKG